MGGGVWPPPHQLIFVSHPHLGATLGPTPLLACSMSGAVNRGGGGAGRRPWVLGAVGGWRGAAPVQGFALQVVFFPGVGKETRDGRGG